MIKEIEYKFKLACDYCSARTFIRKFLFNKEMGYTRFICVDCDKKEGFNSLTEQKQKYKGGFNKKNE